MFPTKYNKDDAGFISKRLNYLQSEDLSLICNDYDLDYESSGRETANENLNDKALLKIHGFIPEKEII